MYSRCCVTLSLVFLSATFTLKLKAQQNGDPPYGFPPSSRVESRQGQPDQPDVIGHRHISKGNHLKCILVEHHPKHVDDGAACLVKFDDGDKFTLKSTESMRAPKDGEMSLECLGDRPVRCTVGTW